ncbi:MAG: glucosaminidase domain-containing protein [Treponemataceae bacterium]|nr:glucosaminidase domain-containing protein [Treponemataceae bacterium]
MRKIIAFVVICFVLFTIGTSVFAYDFGTSACVDFVLPFFVYTPQVEPLLSVSLRIDSAGQKTAEELVSFFMNRNPAADRQKVERLARFYVEEGAAEGINSDIAFVQMCLETGYLKFGGLVTVDMNNFCGLGAMDKEHRGNVFETEQLGVRAHIQHLHAYGTTRELVNECIDNRYKYVKPRGKAPFVFGLAGTWASDKQYGEKLRKLLFSLSAFDLASAD